MESFFSRYRNALVLIAVLLAQVIGLAVQVRRPDSGEADKGGVRLIRSWVVGLVTPPERLLHGTGRGIRGLWTNYVDLIHVRQQNKALKSELDRVRLEEDSMAEDARQGQRLQGLLGFKEKYVYKTVAAQVIGTSGTEQSQVLLIDKGSKDGIRPDMPVITPDGIVGKTRDVFRHTSQVLEISDATSGAGVILEKTRIRGVLRGDTWGQPEIVNVSPDDRIQRGEAVLTSGGDAIYPRGLAVGTVDRVRPDPEGTLVNVLVRPSANLSRLEEVLVITSTGEEVPSEMQQDLTEAEQAEQKASDVLAERLPSRVDPNAPADQQQEPEDDSAEEGAARPVKPPAALHPDRYTPSDTPPAADLVPGQKITDGQSQATSGNENGAENPPKAPANPESGAAPGTTAKPGKGKPATKPAGNTAAKPKPKPAAVTTPGDQPAPGAQPPATNPPATNPQATNAAPATPSQTTPQSPQRGVRAWL
jgi:rod shape-determining protein MreC